jgi:membrane protein YqaA with SNARE-associated domain
LILDAYLQTLGYWGVFIVIFLINVIPAFMPPSWRVLSLVYAMNPAEFSVLPLAFVGCIASTLGRVALTYMGVVGREAMSAKRKGSLDNLRGRVESWPGGGFILSFVVALSPLPSNAYFLAIGMMKYGTGQVYAGFALGRFISYIILIELLTVAERSLSALFSTQLLPVSIFDILGFSATVVFTIIDWPTLLDERKVKFIMPSFRRRRPSPEPAQA